MTKKKKPRKKIKNSTKLLSTVLVALILVFLTVWTYQYSIYDKLSKQEMEIQSQIDEELKTKEKLEKEKEYMDSDTFIEDVARRQLDMLKPNQMIIINDSEKK